MYFIYFILSINNYEVIVISGALSSIDMKKFNYKYSSKNIENNSLKKIWVFCLWYEFFSSFYLFKDSIPMMILHLI